MLLSVFRAMRTARMLQYSRPFRAGVALRAWDDGTRSYPEKSETCSSSTGAPLTEYYSSDAAQRGAFHVIERYGTVLEPYQCDQCSLWHLAPSDSPMLTSGGPTRMPSFEEHGDDDYAMSAFEAVDEAAYSELQHLFDQETEIESALAPRRTRACECASSDGSPKRSYDRREAQRQVARGAGRGVRLAVYECPARRGAWHLTSS